MQPVTDPLKNLVFPGADASFILYNDDGNTYRYEKGDYSTIKFSWDDKSRTLTLGKIQGISDEKFMIHTFKVLVINQNNNKGCLNQEGGFIVKYDGKKQTIKINQ